MNISNRMIVPFKFDPLCCCRHFMGWQATSQMERHHYLLPAKVSKSHTWWGFGRINLPSIRSPELLPPMRFHPLSSSSKWLPKTPWLQVIELIDSLYWQSTRLCLLPSHISLVDTQFPKLHVVFIFYAHHDSTVAACSLWMGSVSEVDTSNHPTYVGVWQIFKIFMNILVNPNEEHESWPCHFWNENEYFRKPWHDSHRLSEMVFFHVCTFWTWICTYMLETV